MNYVDPAFFERLSLLQDLRTREFIGKLMAMPTDPELSVSVSDCGIAACSWTDAGDTYRIEYSLDEFISVVISPNSPLYQAASEDIALPAGAYEFRIVATNSEGTSTFVAVSGIVC